MIAAAVALGTANLSDDIDDAIDAADTENISEIFDDLEDTRRDTYATSGFVVGITAIAIILEVLMIVVRFCNIGLVNLKINIFLILVGVVVIIPSCC